ncbi:MAG TPA: MFS transporter [Acidobacteriaceae bacterium]|nr:MFS transporter [Acidobacteriaceae bacterium]
MAAVTETAKGRMTGREWTVVGLLVLSVVINYVDRSNLALAAQPIQREFTLSPVQYGELLSAFSWTYALLQLLGTVGWVTDRFPVGWVMVGGYVLWTASTALTGLVTGFAALYATRLLLGVGESVAYPCYSRVFAEMPQTARGRANAFIDAGTKLGPALGALLGGMILEHYHWRVLFVALGAGGLLWIIPWIALMPRPEEGTAAKSSASRLSIVRLLRVKSAWGAFIGHFCGNYFYYFLMLWLPNYLMGEQKMGIGAASRVTSAVFLLTATTTVAMGWVSDHLIAAGASPTLVRRAATGGGLTLASSLMVLALVDHNIRLSIGVMCVACVGFGTYASNHWAITQTLAGPAIAGRWSSVQNGVANLSGVAAPWIAGWILQNRGSSRMAFAFTGAVALVGGLAWWLLVEKVEEVRWGVDALDMEEV